VAREPRRERFPAREAFDKILANIAFHSKVAKKIREEPGIMRAETQKIVEEIEQSFGLLRRSL
jgi:hypothetical protein